MLHRSIWKPIRRMTMLAMVLSGPLPCGLQGQVDPETARRYEDVVMEVLTTRLASDVTVDRGRVALRTPASRTLKELTAVVRASVPYYLEGALVEFKRFRPRVKDALSALDGWEIPPVPRGWDEGEWTYFQVQGAVEEVVLLVALDIGVFTNVALAEDVRARDELATDWTRIRGGTDPIDTSPLPDFGEPSSDNSTLDGLGGATEEGAVSSDELAAALRALRDRIAALERRSPETGSTSVSGGFPRQGPDGTWLPAGSGRHTRGVPERLPEQFTLQFPVGSAALGLSAEYGLNTLIEWMVALPNLRVLVTGHSDASGSERANMELSRRRAQIVRYYLLERGIGAERVTSAHFGEQRPEWGIGLDRRVEVRLMLD